MNENLTPDDHVEKISLCLNAVTNNRITPGNFLWAIPLWLVYRWRLSFLFDKLTKIMQTGDIERQVANLSSGSLYILAEACIYLPTRKKDRKTYLEWSKNRNVQEVLRRDQMEKNRQGAKAENDRR